VNSKLSIAALTSAMVLIGGYEGYSTRLYLDPVGIPTACFGATRDISTDQKPEECAALLVRDVVWASRVLDCIDVPLTDNQQTALVSWAYNVGANAACTSTLVRLANAGVPTAHWCAELDRWVYAGGRKLPGLVRRRAEERELCLR